MVNICVRKIVSVIIITTGVIIITTEVIIITTGVIVIEQCLKWNYDSVSSRRYKL